MFKVELTENELMLLNGNCSPEIQEKINLVLMKKREFITGLNETESNFVIDIKQFAKKNGKLSHKSSMLRACNVCGNSAGYAKRKRACKYHTKGSTDYSKPLYLSGFDFGHISCVTMIGYPTLGCCNSCAKKLLPYIADQVKGLEAEIPQSITGNSPEYKRVFFFECECGWRGLETEMGELNALLGGKYYGECPSCHKKNLPFGPTHIKGTQAWAVVHV